MSKALTVFSCILFIAFVSCSKKEETPAEKFSSYDQLVSLFKEWRKFQAPEMKNGVPDYSVEAMKKQHNDLAAWQKKLNSFDTTKWPIKHQVDWYLVWAEMNGLDFDHRVIRPWERDPAFYVWFYTSQPDVPEREGPNIFGAIELNLLAQPLSAKDAEEIATRLRKAQEVFEQGKINLTGNAKDLWVLGARSIREQSEELSTFAKTVSEKFPDLAKAANEAKESSDQFAAWLDEQAPKKTGLSGIGEENYNWYLKNVHLLSYTWHDEKVLQERELSRAHSGLRLAEYRNRKLAPLSKVTDADSYKKMLTQGVEEYIRFFDEGEFITVKPYMKPAMLAQIRDFVPSNDIRGFFDEVDYRDPMAMRAHQFHWIDKQHEIEEPNESPIRKVPLLYNIFDSRAEGLATAMEELIMNAGMLENRPRAKELIYIMSAQRAARGLGGLYQHSNEMNFDQATEYASKWVPWGLLPAKGGTIQHEEQFYLQQPGYGSSYLIGKIDLDKLIAEYARQREGKFVWKEFMDEFMKVGIIPMPLIHWQMTGDKSLLPK
jgi:hypothetical protein